MNEKTLLCLCYLAGVPVILLLAKRLSNIKLFFAAILGPLVVYVLLIVAFAMLAIAFGDK